MGLKIVNRIYKNEMKRKGTNTITPSTLSKSIRKGDKARKGKIEARETEGAAMYCSRRANIKSS